MKDDLAYIEHILLAISNIQDYTSHSTQADFEENQMLQDAVIRSIEIIGEAAKNVFSDMKMMYYEVPWKEMAGMRDKLIHDYMGVDTAVVWKTVEIDIPQLSELLKDIVG